jgi:raffinose/stachyose/melibiose transport system substrate-binding protein
MYVVSIPHIILTNFAGGTMKKLLTGLLVLGMAASLFAGGSRQASGGAAPSGSSGGVAINFLNLWTPVPEANFVGFDTRFKQFQADNPTVTVTSESIQHDGYETKVKTYISGGLYPDVYQAKGTMAPQLVDDDVVYSVKEIMNLVPGWEAQFKDGAFGDFMYNGTAYAFPMQLGNNHNLFWNSDIFRECGITEFPKDYPAFQDACEKIKAKGYIPIVQGNKAQWVVPSLLLNTITYRYTGIDWYVSLRDNKGAKFTDKPFVDSAALLQQMAKAGYFNSDVNSIDQHQMYTVYYNKKAAMIVDGFWGITTFDTEMPKDVLAATRISQFPSVPASMGGGGDKYAKINQAGAGWGYFVTKRKGDTPEKLKAIATMLYYITGSDEAKIAVENGGLPASKAPNADAGKMTPLYKQLNALLDESQFAPIFDVQLSPQVVDAFYAGTQDLLISAITPQQFAERLQRELDASR